MNEIIRRKKLIWSLVIILLFTFTFTFIGAPYQTAYAETLKEMPKKNVTKITAPVENVNRSSNLPKEAVTPTDDLPKRGKGRLEVPSMRGSNSKTFLEPDGTFSTDVYPQSIFYKNNKQNWVPIESNLIPTDAAPFKSKNNANRFSAMFGDNSKVRFAQDDFSLDFQPSNANPSQGVVSGNKIKYDGVYGKVDIEYTSYNDMIKEDIILESADAQNTFTFDVNTKNLHIEKDSKTGLLTLYNNKNKPVGYFMAPFMVDGKDTVSDKVTLDYKEVNGKDKLIITADSEWLKDPSRSYPVRIDPTLSAQVVKDTFVSSVFPTNDFSSYTLFSSGYDSTNYGTTRSFIQFLLPTLPSSSKVTSASLSLYQLLTNTSTNVGVHKITSNWTASTTKWNSQPSFNATAESAVNSAATGYWNFYISNLTKSWYDATSPNYGVAVKHANETEAVKRFNSSNASSNLPIMTINYSIDPIGAEDHWEFTPEGVNGYNGNLLYQATDLNIPGRGIPVSFTRSYNSRSAKDSIFGYGWSSNVGISIKDSGYGPIVFTDEDGTEHVFQRNDNGSYTAPTGVNLTLVKNPTSGIYTMTAVDGTTMEFNSAGQLTKISDTQNVQNSTTFTYVSGKLSTITDASGRITSFYYNASGKLSKITDPSSRNILYGYDAAGNLTTVTDPAGKVTTYNYDTNHNLTGVTDPNNNTRTYVYDVANDRVDTVKQNVTVNGTLKETSTKLVYTTGTGTSELLRTDSRNIQTKYTFDDKARVTEKIEDFGDATHLNRKSVYVYDEENHVKDFTDPNGKHYTYGYVPGTDNLATQGNPLNETYQYNYDSTKNNLIQETRPDDKATNNNYDSSNNNTETMDTSVQISASRYKDNGNLQYEVPAISSSENLVWDSSIEYALSSYDKFAQNAAELNNMSVSTTISRFGNKSLAIGNTTGWATFENTNTIAFDNTKTFTLSSYVKTDTLSSDAAYIMINLYDANYVYLGEVRSQKVGGTTPWTRIQVTIDKNNVPVNTAFIAAAVGRSAATGNSYYDGLQLEVGSARSSYNMVNDFETDVNVEDGVPDWWTFSPALGAGEGLDASVKKIGNASFKMIGQAGVNKSITSRINVTGDSTSKLILSGIANADNPNPNGGKFAISAKVNYTDGATGEFTGNFAKESGRGWQPVTVNIAPAKAFNSIDVTYYFENQQGNAWFDNACLLEDDKGTEYNYDVKDNYVTSVKDSLGHTTRFEYDAIGNRTKVTDPKNNSTSFVYDLMNRLTQVTDALLGITKYGYDNNGNRTTVTDAKNHVTTYGYNELNQVKSITDPLNNSITFDYDEAGNQTAINYPGKNNDAAGYKVGLGYDNANRLKSISYNGTSQYTFDYDNNGNRTGIVDVRNNNRTTQYRYDEDNKMLEMVYDTAKPTDKVNYAYDAVGNITSLTTTIGLTGYTTTFNYDAADQMTKVTSGSAEKSFVYDEQGSVLSTLTSDKTSSYFNYDNAGRLTGLKLQKNNYGSLGNYKYSYDANGNITSVTYSGDSIGSGTISYTYDELNRLTKETLRDGTTKEYFYDAVGNRIQRKVTSPTGSVSTGNYTYGDANQLLSVNSNNGYAYDKNGNMLSDGSKNFDYDYDNRLIKVTRKSDGSLIAQYEYDADGRRTATITPTGTTKYYYDGNSTNVLYETDGSGNLLARYIYGSDYKPVAMVRGGNAYYYHYNGHGDVVALTDSTGAVVAEYDYDAYGGFVTTGKEGTIVNPLRYAGYRYDSETGFYYLNARYYWPAVGRFITRDSFHGVESKPASLNQYNYAFSNPIKYIDPSGHLPFSRYDFGVAVRSWGIKVWFSHRVVQWVKNNPDLTRDLPLIFIAGALTASGIGWVATGTISGVIMWNYRRFVAQDRGGGVVIKFYWVPGWFDFVPSYIG